MGEQSRHSYRLPQFILIVVLLAAGGSAAQEEPASPPPETITPPPREPASPPPETITPPPREVAPLEDKKLDQFADAYIAIESIHAQAAAELERTTDPDEANKVKERAETQIIEAVERSGLRLEEFNQIAELMKIDEAVRAKITTRIEKRRGI